MRTPWCASLFHFVSRLSLIHRESYKTRDRNPLQGMTACRLPSQPGQVWIPESGAANEETDFYMKLWNVEGWVRLIYFIISSSFLWLLFTFFSSPSRRMSDRILVQSSNNKETWVQSRGSVTLWGRKEPRYHKKWAFRKELFICLAPCFWSLINLDTRRKMVTWTVFPIYPKWDLKSMLPSGTGRVRRGAQGPGKVIKICFWCLPPTESFLDPEAFLL